MAGLLKAPRGTADVLPTESYRWRWVEGKFLDLAEKFGFGEIRFPTFEHTELFLRGVGDTTDVVEKEMYTFLDKSNRSITLKPEGTSGAARAILESGIIHDALPLKLSYITPCFRYDKPQAGRLREFHQFGVESFGSNDPASDAEVIALAYEYFTQVGLTGFSLEINSIGCPQCRPQYNQHLKTYFTENKEQLCTLCTGRLDRNPLRILDCKEASCKSLVEKVDMGLNHLCEACDTHFAGLKSQLNLLEIPYTINPKIVRGLDYYTKTVFEFVTQHLGAQSTICGGGRYDGLVELLGGKPTPAVGFALGVERLLLLADEQDVSIGYLSKVDLYFVCLDLDSKDLIVKLSKGLRRKGLCVEYDIMGRSLKAQMKYANKIGARYTTVIGEREVESGMVMLKEMDTGVMLEVQAKDIAHHVG